MIENLKPEDVPGEVIDAVAEYLARRVFAEVTREEVDKVKAKILTEIELYDERPARNGRAARCERITDPKRDWACVDDEVMARYYAAVDTALRAAHLKPADMAAEYCPALVAEHERVKAEWALLDAAAGMLGLDYKPGELNDGLLCLKDGLSKRQEFIDLTVKLVLSL